MNILAILLGACALILIRALARSYHNLSVFSERQHARQLMNDREWQEVSPSATPIVVEEVTSIPQMLRESLANKVPMPEKVCKTLRLRCTPQKKSNGFGSIIYLNNGRAAGLRDVKSVLQQIASMAAPLCANVFMPSPSALLKYDSHNNGIPLPENLPWSDYLDITRRQDGAGMIVNKTKEEVNSYAANNATHIILRSHNGTEVMEQYKRIIELARKGQHFVWELRTNVYEWRDEFSELSVLEDDTFMFPLLKNVGCKHAKLSASDIQFEIMDKFMDRLNATSFTSFHIRRGDDVDACDSSPEFLTSYLNCSYATCKSKREDRDPLVVFTNEGSESYIENVRRVAEQHTGTMIHGDKLLQEVIDSMPGNRTNVKDNFYLFGAAELIMKNATQSLVRHRNHCASCDALCIVPSEE